MIHETKFLISRRPYAVDLNGMAIKTTHEEGRRFHSVSIRAVWYRRRRGETVACVGYLWDYLSPAPVDIHEALERMDDGRYGGDCAGRWDGKRYWGAQKPAEIERHLELLRPMLANYPAVPPGFAGWWRYETDRELAAKRE